MVLLRNENIDGNIETLVVHISGLEDIFVEFYKFKRKAENL